MFRVLIVDDEPLIRRGLIETVDWEAHGLEISGEAGNGSEALEMIKTLKPNLVITDIKMPIMDGIELIQNVRALELPTRIIVLSGYNDYAYLKKAIEYNVDNYLLKPLNHEELNEVLSNTSANIEIDYWNMLYKSEGIQSLKKNTLSRLIVGNISPNEFKDKKKMCEIRLSGEACGIMVGFHGKAMTDDMKDAGNIQVFSLVNVCSETIKDVEGEVFADSVGRIVILLDQSGQDEINRVQYILLSNVKKYLGIDMTFGLDMVASMTDISTAYEQLIAVHERSSLSSSLSEEAGSQESQNLSRHDKLIEDVLDYSKEHHYENLSIKLMSEQFQISASYLGQLIKKSKGISYTEIVNGFRIDKAVEYLQTSTMKVYEIAEEVGYTNYQYFVKMFKKHTGKTPSDYIS